LSQGLWPFQISCTSHSPIRKNPARNFPRSFFIRPRRLNPWTVKSCRSDLRYGDARLVVHRFKLGLKRQRRNRPKYITLAFFHSAIRDTTLTLTASQAHYFQTSSLFLFCVCSFFTNRVKSSATPRLLGPWPGCFALGTPRPLLRGAGGILKKDRVAGVRS
jgi:hypothetical protein